MISFYPLLALAQTGEPQSMADRVKQVQRYLQQQNLSGWLLYDFHGSNSIAREFVNPSGMVTRRWFYFIPESGRPIALVHQIEKENFPNLVGYVETYAGREELVHKLEQILAGHKNILMEYSPKGNNPYVSQVDAGTLELIKSLGAKIQSSQDLVQYLLARWSNQNYRLHQEAAANLLKIKDKAFQLVAEQVKKNASLSEYDLQQFILKEFGKAGLVTDSGPICAVNQNSGNPHYSPTKEKSLPIRKGDLLLLDLWAKQNKPEAVYADITWMAYVGDKVPEKYAMIFEIVANARDTGVEYLKKNWPQKSVAGWQVDNVVRDLIRKAGYADFFPHRTGHSLGKSVHSIGVNLDNFETKDERKIIPGVAFTIEPGIYLKDFGVRSEINVYAGEKGIEVTTLPLQQEIIPLLKSK
jgi:Xaa-Pro aminopeptidase